MACQLKKVAVRVLKRSNSRSARRPNVCNESAEMDNGTYSPRVVSYHGSRAGQRANRPPQTRRASCPPTAIRDSHAGLERRGTNQGAGRLVQVRRSRSKTDRLSPIMPATAGRRSLRIVLLFAAFYLVIGIAFAAFSDSATTNAIRLMWRRLAWLVCGVGFAAHILCEGFRLRNSPRLTAMHASVAAALAAGGLAVGANLHEWRTASRYRPSIALALVAWPLLTAIPAFVVAVIGAALLDRWRRR